MRSRVALVSNRWPRHEGTYDCLLQEFMADIRGTDTDDRNSPFFISPAVHDPINPWLIFSSSLLRSFWSISFTKPLPVSIHD